MAVTASVTRYNEFIDGAPEMTLAGIFGKEHPG